MICFPNDHPHKDDWINDDVRRMRDSLMGLEILLNSEAFKPLSSNLKELVVWLWQ